MSSATERRVARVCEFCGTAFASPASWTGRFCSRPCHYAWRRAQPRQWTPDQIRRLRDDEPLPSGPPQRYIAANGYAILRWKIGVRSYVEALEHRVVTGRSSPHVHHINRIKADNRPENLQPVSTAEHGAAHCSWNVWEACALYRDGWSLPRLAVKYGKDTSRIMRALKLRGVTMRSWAEQWALRRARVI